MNPNRRLPALNWTCHVAVNDRVHSVDVCLAFDPETGEPREVAMTGLGKAGTHLDLAMHKLSIGLSRLMQYRDPETGDYLMEIS